MLSLTRKTDYALVALGAMARHGWGTVSAQDLSRRLGVPARLITNVLNQLKHRGLVQSTRGIRGGYGLAKPPERITLTELIEAIEGPIRLAKCCGGLDEFDEGKCQLGESCLMKEPVRRLHVQLRDFFSQVTLHDLAWNTVVLKVAVTARNGVNHGGTSESVRLNGTRTA